MYYRGLYEKQQVHVQCTVYSVMLMLLLNHKSAMLLYKVIQKTEQTSKQCYKIFITLTNDNTNQCEKTSYLFRL